MAKRKTNVQYDNWADKTVTSYEVDPTWATGNYTVNRVTRARVKNSATKYGVGKPLTASNEFVVPARGGRKASAYSNSEYIRIPGTNTYTKAGVVGPKSIVSTEASRKNVESSKKRDAAMRRGSKNPRAGR
jgi:hypothetical protein